MRLFRRSLRGWRAGFLLGVVAVLGAISIRVLILPAPLAEQPDLIILSGADDSVNGQRQALVRRWNIQHPEMTARIEELSHRADDQHSEMVARAQSGTSNVDVYNLDVTWIAEFASAQYIRPLSGVNTNGFLPGPLRAGIFDGKLWALPFNTDAGLLYYRTDIVGPGKAALPDKLPPSLNDMTAVLRIKPDLKAGYVGQLANYEGLTVNALEAIWAAGGDVVDEDNNVVLDKTPDALRQLAAEATDQQPHAVLPESRDYDEADSRDAFRRGEVAFMRNWPVAYDWLKSADPPADPFGVMPLPTPSVLGGQSLAVAADSRHPAAATELIEFLTNSDSERQLFREGGLPATRADAYSDPDVVKARPYAPILFDALNRARPRPITSHYPLFSTRFREIVEYALGHGGSLPKDAVPQLTAALRGQLR